MSGLVLLVLSALELHRLGPARPFVPEPYTGASVVRFAAGDSILLTHDNPHLTPDISSFRYVLVHLARPASQADLAALRRDGLEPVGYFAYQNVICRRTTDGQGPATNVGAVLPLLPEYRLAPEFRQSRSAARSPVVLSLWPGEDARAAAAGLAALGADVIDVTPRTISAVADPLEAASLDAVAWVQAPGRCEPFNVDVQWVMQTGWWPEVPDPVRGRRVWQHGVRGQGMLIGLFDSGIKTDHQMFRDPALPIAEPGIFPGHRKVAAYKLFRDAVFGDATALTWHGSGVAGTLAGNDAPVPDSSLLDGIAPDARIYFLDIGSNSRYIYYDDVTEMLDSVRLGLGMAEPPRQVSGSFGSRDGLGYYRLAEAALDAVCWKDKDFLVVWAAGNDGPERYRLGHPACAKNALTVGGTGNGTSSNRLFPGSSRGPCRDDRIKPNVVAPGESVLTVHGADTATYALKFGTSYSSPAVSAALCLVRQYLKEGRHPTGEPDPGRSIERPSSALLRALAVTGADSGVGAVPVPNKDVGWGRFDLSSVLHFPDDSLTIDFVDERAGPATGEYDEYGFELPWRRPLRVTLAWTDTAAPPQAEVALVNDLNLEIISPDDNRYRGNQITAGQSAANPPYWDERNVEEVCQLFQPLAGRWRVRVYARSVYTARQPYALVVKAAGVAAGIAAGPAPSAPGCPTLFVRSGRPLPLPAPARARVRLFGTDGRLRQAFDAARPALAPGPGVYYYDLAVEGEAAGRGRLVVVR